MTRYHKPRSTRTARRMCRNNDAVLTPSLFTLADGAFLLVLPHLSATQKSIARRLIEVRMAAVSVMLEARTHPAKGRAVTLQLTDESVIEGMDALAARLARCYGMNRITIWRWRRAFLRAGYRGLARKRRSDLGESRFFRKHLQLAFSTLQSALARKDRAVSLRAVYRFLCEECRRAAIRPCSYETLRSFVKAHQ